MTISAQVQEGFAKAFAEIKSALGIKEGATPPAAPAVDNSAVVIELRNHFTELQSKFTQLQTEHTQKVTAITGEKTALEGKVTQLTTDLTAANTKATDLENTIKDPKGLIAQQVATLAASQGVTVPLDIKPGSDDPAKPGETKNELKGLAKVQAAIAEQIKNVR